MTRQEKIKFFESALKYFSWWNTFKRKFRTVETYNGFCSYFEWEHHLSYSKINILKTIWIKYRTTEPGLPFHFVNNKERRKALKRIIKDLQK